jgi:predicted esterase
MEHFIHIQRSARYFTQGNSSSKKLLIALHGYGQLAQFFIRKFSSIGDEWYVVAPEGLHRFYLNGHSGRVGASWMTKEVRDKDIEDNNEWLHQLLKKLHFDNNYEETVLLGFSQGAATASRYFYSNQSEIDRLIVWASVFPPDIDKNVFVIGTEDPFFTTEQREEVLSFFHQLNFDTVEFEGNHDIDEKTLRNIL